MRILLYDYACSSTLDGQETAPLLDGWRAVQLAVCKFVVVCSWPLFAQFLLLTWPPNLTYVNEELRQWH